MSEDCLNLNMYIPISALNQSTEPLAVLLHMHGGAFFTGSNDDAQLQGEYLAWEQNVIVIQMNYRLAAFGFWYLEESDENGYQTNWGILDQTLAMNWVQMNIEGFGGDPNRVTISGCSAGGQSILIHATSQLSWPYFQQMSSFSAPLGIPFFTTTEAAQIYKNAANSLGCLKPDNKTDITCLRGKDTDEIYEATMSFTALQNNIFPVVLDSGKLQALGEPYAPVVGDKIIPKHPYDLIRDGKLKPATKLTIEYAHHEGEQFLETVFYPLEEPVLENRHSRIPLKIWEALIYKVYGSADGQRIIDLYACREKCIGSARCDCGELAEQWLTSWSWSCHIRSGTIKMFF